MYIDVNLPAGPGQIISTPSGYKSWEYVASDSQRPNAVGRFAVKFEVTPGGPGGGGGTYKNPNRFVGGEVITATTDAPQVIGGEEIVNIHHDLDFGVLPRLENL